jgi:hypothetical protein
MVTASWIVTNAAYLDTESDVITASYTVVNNTDRDLAYLYISTAITLSKTIYEGTLDVQMYAQLLQADQTVQTSFTCTTFMPASSPIGSSFIVNSYSGPGALDTATGNWYTQLKDEKVPVEFFTDQGNWFWDGTVSSQIYADD